MPGRSKLGLDEMRGRASDVPGLSRLIACCSARKAVPDVSGRDASINGWGSKKPQPASLARAATGSLFIECCWRWCLIHLPSSVSGGARRSPSAAGRRGAPRSDRANPRRAVPRRRVEALRGPRPGAPRGLGFALQGLHGQRRGMLGLPFRGQLAVRYLGATVLVGPQRWRSAPRFARGQGRWRCGSAPPVDAQ